MSRSRNSTWRAAAAALGLLLLRQFVAPVEGFAETLAWAVNYNGASGGHDSARAVAVGPGGAVYVAGRTFAAGRSNDLLLQKYTASGACQWTRISNGSGNGSDGGYGVAVGPDGVYLVGRAVRAGQFDDLLLQKYSHSGVRLWSRFYNGAADGYDSGLGVAVGPDGSVYVTGETVVAGQASDLLLQKYSPAGARLWTMTYNGAANGVDGGVNVTVGPDGSIYVVGNTYVAGHEADALLQKYLPTGALVWTRTFNGSGNRTDVGHGVALGADGSIFVAGFCEMAGPSTDVFLRKYSAAGAPRWTRFYNGAANGADNGDGVAVGPGERIYVSGGVDVALQGTDVLVSKYLPTGAPDWGTTYNGVDNGFDRGYGIAVTPGGTVYVAGQTEVAGQSADLLLLKYVR